VMSLYYRAMGSEVGANTSIDTALCTAFDLVTIGADSSIGSDTQILGYRVEDGWLILGDVNIGNGCFVGTHCCLGLNVAMGDGAQLDDMSLLADGTTMAPKEARRASPAEPAQVLAPKWPRVRSRRGFLFGLIHLALIYTMGYLLLFSLAPGAVLVAYGLWLGGPALGIAAAYAA